jgi:hypothetical protein
LGCLGAYCHYCPCPIPVFITCIPPITSVA